MEMDERTTATRRTLARTRWLSELAETLELAGNIALQLGEVRRDGDQAATLSRQIGALLAEVDSLRRAKPAAPIDPHPDWMI